MIILIRGLNGGELDILGLDGRNDVLAFFALH